MEIIVNKPLAETFGWLQAGAKRIDLQDKIKNISYVLGPGESRVLFLEDPGASEYEITLGEGARMDLVQLREASGKGLSYNNVRVKCGDKAYFGWYRVVLGRAPSRPMSATALTAQKSTISTARLSTPENARRAPSQLPAFSLTRPPNSCAEPSIFARAARVPSEMRLKMCFS